MLKKIIVTLSFMAIVALQANAATYLDIINQTVDTINQMNQYTPTTVRPQYTPTTTSEPTESSPQTSQQPKETPQSEYDNIPQGSIGKQQNNSVNKQYATLGELPQGTLVTDPSSVWNYRNGYNYSGEIQLKLPVFWRKLEDNHYTQGTTLLLSDSKVANYDFCHYQKGLRAWNESDARRFLRTTFYTHLSEGFRNAIVNVNIPFADLTGKPANVLDNLFLLSIVEWGASNRSNNGKVIKYDDLPNIYRANNIWVASDGLYRISQEGTFATRTINRPEARSAGYTSEVFNLYSDGTLTTSTAGATDDLRPAVNLKSSTKIKGPYKFTYGYDSSKHFIYYELDL